jgi:fumarate hydratase class II
MPGKVNPSIAEMVNQVCFQVIGNDVAITTATEAGQLELNVMMPMVAHNLVFSMQILGTAARVLAERCVEGSRPTRRSAPTGWSGARRWSLPWPPLATPKPPSSPRRPWPPDSP